MAFLKDTNPKLLRELAEGRNEHIDLNTVRNNSGIKAWWICAAKPSHIWESGIRGRAIEGYGCPYCSGLKTQRQDSFAAKHPELWAEWDSTKNEGIDPWAISPLSNKKVFWICSSPQRHQWSAPVKSRVIEGSGCRLCVNNRNPLGDAYPEIASEWHPTKNHPLTPDAISSGSQNIAWWQCLENPKHAWQARVNSRVHSKSGCPKCARSKSTSKRYPPLCLFAADIYSQLHTSKNTDVDL